MAGLRGCEPDEIWIRNTWLVPEIVGYTLCSQVIDHICEQKTSSLESSCREGARHKYVWNWSFTFWSNVYPPLYFCHISQIDICWLNWKLNFPVCSMFVFFFAEKNINTMKECCARFEQLSLPHLIHPLTPHPVLWPNLNIFLPLAIFHSTLTPNSSGQEDW